MPRRNPPIKTAILGAARIVPNAFLLPAQKHEQIDLCLIASNRISTAKSLAAQWSPSPMVLGYQEASEVVDIDFFYVAGLPTTRAAHIKTIVDQTKTNAVILCEKPICQSVRDAKKILSLASSSGIELLEGFHNRHHPSYEKFLQLVQSYLADTPFQASLYFNAPVPYSDSEFRYKASLGGGATMDLGCYLCRTILDLGLTPPYEIEAEPTIGPNGIDVAMRANIVDRDGRDFTISCDMREHNKMESGILIETDNITLTFDDFVIPTSQTELTIKSDAESKSFSNWEGTSYQYQIDNIVKFFQTCSDDFIDDHRPVLAQTRLLNEVLRTANIF